MEDWDSYKEEQKRKREKLEPKRKEIAKRELEKLNYKLEWDDYNRCWNFDGKYKGKFYPYTGWYTAKIIGSNRGLTNLIKKLKGQI